MIYLDRYWAQSKGGIVDQEVNLTTPEDEDAWTLNFRIPDLVLLDPPRFHIERIEFMAGAPLVVVEIASPGDETFDKFPFYAGLGVPEVWVIHRDTRTPEIHQLAEGSGYRPVSPDANGWLRSPATGVEFRQTQVGKVWARIAGDESTAQELPKD